MRLAIVLTSVCIVAALILAAVYQNTAPLIAAQKEKQIQQALKRAMPAADNFTTKQLDEKMYHQAYKGNKLIGYIVPAKGEGYSGDIEIMVGIDKSGTITGLEILNQQETPGLGARCIEVKYGEASPWFTKQFQKKKPEDITPKNIEAITGATITTKAIIDIVKQDVMEFFDKIKK